MTSIICDRFCVIYCVHFHVNRINYSIITFLIVVLLFHIVPRRCSAMCYPLNSQNNGPKWILVLSSLVCFRISIALCKSIEILVLWRANRTTFYSTLKNMIRVHFNQNMSSSDIWDDFCQEAVESVPHESCETFHCCLFGQFPHRRNKSG